MSTRDIDFKEVNRDFDLYFDVPERFNRFAQLQVKDGVSTSIYELIYWNLNDDSVKAEFNRQVEKVASDLIQSLPDKKRQAILDSIDDSFTKTVITKISVGNFTIKSKRLSIDVDSEMSFKSIKTPLGVYVGSTLNGKPHSEHGQLTMLTMMDGIILEGIFEDGEIVSGMITWNSGSTYNGTIKDNMMYGKGVYTRNDYSIHALWSGHLIMDKCLRSHIGEIMREIITMDQ